MHQLQSKYFDNMDEAVKQFDANNKKVIQDFLLEAKVTIPQTPSTQKKKKKVRKVLEGEERNEDGTLRESGKKMTKIRTKRPKVERLLIPECASDHKMTVSQKVRMENNLRRREELK